MMAFLQSTLVHVAPFLIIISLIVTIHELGHFLTARAFGVAIDCFSIGFGPAIVSWRDRSGVEWRISWLPLGGYVKFAGDDNVASVPEQSDLETWRQHIVANEGVGAERKYLPFKPLGQRALVALAGPAANFVLAIALFSAFFLAFGKPVTSNRVESVVPASAAARAGFRTGDVVIQADSKPIREFDDLQFYVQYRGGVPIDFTVLRNGQSLHLMARPDTRQVDSPAGGKEGVGVLGLAARASDQAPVNPVQAFVLGVQKTWDVTCTTLFYLGRIVTGQWIRKLHDLPPARVTVLDVTPRQLLALAGDRLPTRYRRGLEHFSYGPGVCKVDWALDGPVPWQAEQCREAVTLHVGGTFSEVAQSEADVAAGRHADRPFCLVTQPSIIDPTRAPTGKHTLWAYCHVPNGSNVDMTERIEAQIERFAPGFRDLILAKVTTTAVEAEQHNPSYVGGDIGAGAATLRQTVFRPTARWNPYRTGIKGVYLCSASTPPGGGVHGMCGQGAAHTALHDLGDPIPRQSLRRE